MIDTAVLDQEWRAALADAGIDSAQTRVYLMEGVGQGEGGRGAGAVWFPPGDELVLEDQFPDANRIDDANDPAHINLHRMSLRLDDDVALTAGRMRHELEHARQYDALGRAIFNLQGFVEDALALDGSRHERDPRQCGSAEREPGRHSHADPSRRTGDGAGSCTELGSPISRGLAQRPWACSRSSAWSWVSR